MKCPNCQTENSEKAKFCQECGQALIAVQTASTQSIHRVIPIKIIPQEPASFAGGRYQVKRLLGEGGRKRVYLVNDTVLDRDVAFAQIKTEKLDEEERTRIKREAQAMGRLGDHPNIVAVYDFGEDEGHPYIVLPLLPGGDVEDLIEKAPNHRLSIENAISIAKAVSNGLAFAHSNSLKGRTGVPELKKQTPNWAERPKLARRPNFFPQNL